MEEFIQLRNMFSIELEKVQKNAELAAWEFYINSTEENLVKYTQAQENYSKLFQNEDTYNQFKKFQEQGLDKHLSKQLKNLLKEFYDELESGKELKDLRDKENEISASYNSFQMEIDNKPISSTEIIKIFENEKDQTIRKKGYKTRIDAGEKIAKDLIELVKMRNTWAKSKGYNNYFEYSIEDTYEISPTNLENLIKEVYEKIKDKCKEVFDTEQQEIAKTFGISIEELEDYHFGLILQNSPEKEVSDNIKDVVAIADKAYKGMGYDINNMGITLDLYPRANKNTHGFAFCIEAGKDARILANLTDNLRSLGTILHELGHCVYDMGIDTSLPFLDKDCASSAMTEAIAMMMGDLPKTENILKGLVSDKTLKQFKKELKKDEIKFVMRSLQIIEFEKELYNNPDQDLPQLWKTLKQKYLFRNKNTYKNNEWATIPHYLSHPGYYQNYFRASLIKAQIYNTLLNKLGSITTNNKTANYLKENIFKYGASLEEEELIVKMTGEKLDVKYFCNRF